VWYGRNGGGNRTVININNSTHRTTIINNWNRARNLSLHERQLALRVPTSKIVAHNNAIGTRLAVNKTVATEKITRVKKAGNPANFTQSQKLKDRAKRLADAKKQNQTLAQKKAAAAKQKHNNALAAQKKAAAAKHNAAKTKAERAAATKRAHAKAKATTTTKSKTAKTREQNQKRLQKAKAIEKKQSANTHRKAPASTKVKRTREANQRRLANAKRVQSHSNTVKKHKPTRQLPGVKQNQRKKNKRNGG
jgi:colicin import membrane protein